MPLPQCELAYDSIVTNLKKDLITLNRAYPYSDNDDVLGDKVFEIRLLIDGMIHCQRKVTLQEVVGQLTALLPELTPELKATVESHVEALGCLIPQLPVAVKSDEN